MRMDKKPPATKAPNDTEWVVSWDAVEEAQLRTWLRATPAQRLALAEELLSLSQKARTARKRNSGKLN